MRRMKTLIRLRRCADWFESLWGHARRCVFWRCGLYVPYYERQNRMIYELAHDKTNKMACAPSEDSDQPGHPPVWSESSQSARRKLGPLATHWANSKDSGQTGRMPRLICVFAGRTFHLVGFVVRWLIWESRKTKGACTFAQDCWEASPFAHIFRIWERNDA